MKKNKKSIIPWVIVLLILLCINISYIINNILENPEKKIIELLLEGPKEKNLKRIIPENTKIISIEKNGETAVLKFSKELKSGEEFTNNKENIINSILKTALQLNEISNIKILVEGEEI